MSITAAATSTLEETESLRVSKIRRLHHHTYPIADQEANRHFMEDLLGIPLRATWTEGPSADGMQTCHTFFELADGGAMAFFQMSKPFDKKFLIGRTNTLDHIALEATEETQNEIRERLEKEGISYWFSDHGYCKSIYVDSPDGLLVEICTDPPDVDSIRAIRSKDAHSELRRWLAGDHTNNNYRRTDAAPRYEFKGRSLYDPETYGKD